MIHVARQSISPVEEFMHLYHDYIRQGLMVWKEAKLKTLSVEDHPPGRRQLAGTRIRHHPVRLSKMA
jgi:hypothetical protein